MATRFRKSRKHYKRKTKRNQKAKQNRKKYLKRIFGGETFVYKKDSNDDAIKLFKNAIINYFNNNNVTTVFINTNDDNEKRITILRNISSRLDKKKKEEIEKAIAEIPEPKYINYQLRLLDEKKEKNPNIVFTFDDTKETVSTEALTKVTREGMYDWEKSNFINANVPVPGRTFV